MQIIEICEPNANLDNSKEIAVGIDFGTTNSLIAVSFDQAPFIIADNKMQEIIPSKLSYSDVTISSIKRLFGKNFKEITSSEALLNVTSCSLTNINGNARLNIDGKLLSAVEIASSIF